MSRATGVWRLRIGRERVAGVALEWSGQDVELAAIDLPQSLVRIGGSLDRLDLAALDLAEQFVHFVGGFAANLHANDAGAFGEHAGASVEVELFVRQDIGTRLRQPQPRAGFLAQDRLDSVELYAFAEEVLVRQAVELDLVHEDVGPQTALFRPVAERLGENHELGHGQHAVVAHEPLGQGLTEFDFVEDEKHVGLLALFEQQLKITLSQNMAIDKPGGKVLSCF